MSTTGAVRSFNYANSANPGPNAQGVGGTRQLAGQRWGACVRPGPNQCSITWSQVK